MRATTRTTTMLVLAAILLATGTACEKRIHEASRPAEPAPPGMATATVADIIPATAAAAA
jgi:hypothetical protein